MFVKPPGPRHTAIEAADNLSIRIPSKRNVFILAFLTLWLCGWLFGEVSAPVGFFVMIRKNPAAAAFMLVWLSLWTLGGAAAIFTWLWQVKGAEMITVSPTALSVRHEVFGYGRTKQYDLAEVRGLRVAPFVYNPMDFRSGMAFWGVGGGPLTFDYGFKSYRFGAGVDEAEARIILQKLLNRQPRLADAPAA